MPRPAKNEKGNRYGRLLVINKVPNIFSSQSAARWLCKCDCGTIRKISGNNLRNGSKSCGYESARSDRVDCADLSGLLFRHRIDPKIMTGHIRVEQAQLSVRVQRLKDV